MKRLTIKTVALIIYCITLIVLFAAEIIKNPEQFKIVGG